MWPGPMHTFPGASQSVKAQSDRIGPNRTGLTAQSLFHTIDFLLELSTVHRQEKTRIKFYKN